MESRKAEEKHLATNDQETPAAPEGQKPKEPGDQKPPNDDVANATVRASTPQLPGSHPERMLTLLMPAIAKVIENVDDPKQQRKVLDELRNFTTPGRWVFRTVVGFLGVIALATVLGVVWLALCGKTEQIPDGLIALGSACIGALAGLLANRAS